MSSGVNPGGRYEPSDCQSRHKVAIIVPFRNRTEHLTVFLRYMHPFLQRQQLNYVIIVVEQSGLLLIAQVFLYWTHLTCLGLIVLINTMKQSDQRLTEEC